MLIQKQFEGPFGDVLGLLPKPIEAKVEVIWGRAYLAFLHDYKVFALRDGTFEKYNSDVAGNVLHISVPDTELTWLKEDDVRFRNVRKQIRIECDTKILMPGLPDPCV